LRFCCGPPSRHAARSRRVPSACWTVDPRWRATTVYFLLTYRFANGDPANDRASTANRIAGRCAATGRRSHAIGNALTYSSDQDGADPSSVRKHTPVPRQEWPHWPHPERALPDTTGLLDIPVLYLSRHVARHKADYHRLLQAVRDSGGGQEAWQVWVIYMLKGVAETDATTLRIVEGIRKQMARTKHKMRAELPRLYSQDLLNNLFRHP
jgi:hypothetical protein